jgi:hypothetical protein
MKNLNTLVSVGILLLSIAILFTNCKDKTDDDPVVPAFSITATTVPLQGGGDGLQFDAKCTNDNVTMTKVEILDPLGPPAVTYNLNGTAFVKNEVFGLQSSQEAYYKNTGTWSFTFIGTRTGDGTDFSILTTLAVQ